MNSAEANLTCTVCNNSQLKTVIDFGLQPPSNRFISDDSCESSREIHALALGYCQQCGTAQLTNRMPIEAIRPRYNWLLYNEPESHLDEVAAELTQLPGLNGQSRILGITYKDQSTVDRLQRLGLRQGRCILESDLNVQSQPFGLETIQQVLCLPETLTKIKAKYGVADILIMRHIVEHASDARKLILALRDLISKDGYLVMELPDSEKIFRVANHAFIWEEHISYFTEHTLTSLAHSVKAHLAWFKRCPYYYEDSLVVAFRFHPPTTPLKMSGDENLPSSNDLLNVKETLEKFGHELKAARQSWRERLMIYRDKGEKLAIFGAGHLAAKFINFLNLKDLIDCVIDDHPNKVGLKMPGSLLPIFPSSELVPRGINICISTLSPESEKKVRQKMTFYFNHGGIFMPAFNITKS